MLSQGVCTAVCLSVCYDPVSLNSAERSLVVKTGSVEDKTKTKTGKHQYITKCRSLTSYLIYVVNY